MELRHEIFGIRELDRELLVQYYQEGGLGIPFPTMAFRNASVYDL